MKDENAGLPRYARNNKNGLQSRGLSQAPRLFPLGVSLGGDPGV